MSNDKILEEENEQLGGKEESQAQQSDYEAATSEQDGAGDLEALLEQEREKAANYLANWQRAQADFANLKRRTEQERSEAAKFANAALILSLLPALDDFERALATVPPDLSENPWLDGLRLIQRKLQSSLETQGVAIIPTEGADFDPNFHDAVLYDEGEEGKVVQELQKGYKLFDRVIRPAMVKVGRGLPPAQHQSTDEKEDQTKSTKAGKGHQAG